MDCWLLVHQDQHRRIFEWAFLQRRPAQDIHSTKAENRESHGINGESKEEVRRKLLPASVTMRRTSIPPDNAYMILCPRLGHLISFSYCRFENRGIPCFRIIEFWNDYFLIEDYLRKELANHEWDKAFRDTDQPKITALVESIEKARKTRWSNQSVAWE